ncbi:hypothetical protein QQF64_024860 [Cirrhinus molitorella]|uniref:Uncharacterized protein n=1 Tax=Cirrhinus molitorella TaxID=172907 RepID=A0ABR3NN72_9TELE
MRHQQYRREANSVQDNSKNQCGSENKDKRNGCDSEVDDREREKMTEQQNRSQNTENKGHKRAGGKKDLTYKNEAKFYTTAMGQAVKDQQLGREAENSVWEESKDPAKNRGRRNRCDTEVDKGEREDISGEERKRDVRDKNEDRWYAKVLEELEKSMRQSCSGDGLKALEDSGEISCERKELMVKTLQKIMQDREMEWLKKEEILLTEREKLKKRLERKRRELQRIKGNKKMSKYYRRKFCASKTR